MTPGLPPSAPAANVPSTATWLLLSLVLTTLLAVGRWTQQPATLASPPAPARLVPSARRVALARPARPHAAASTALATAAL